MFFFDKPITENSEYSNLDKKDLYVSDYSNVATVVDYLHYESNKALTNLKTKNEEWFYIIFNDCNYLKLISDDFELKKKFSEVLDNLTRLNMWIAIADIDNKNISYNTNELVKSIRDSGNVLLFYDLNKSKVIDVSISVMRNNSKRLEYGDAFFIQNGDIERIKTPFYINTLGKEVDYGRQEYSDE